VDVRCVFAVSAAEAQDYGGDDNEERDDATYGSARYGANVGIAGDRLARWGGGGCFRY
jgi:hypothetical protein